MRSGFTLMEVCIALAVLSTGVLVFGRYLDGLNRLRNFERNRAQSVIVVAQSVESFVTKPPDCRDTSFVLNGTDASLKAVPGVKPLAWVTVSANAVRPVRLRRLVRCVPVLP